MDRMRRIAPLLAVLVALIVGGEMTDAWPCADADCGVWRVLLHPDVPPDGGNHESSAACLCHATFVSTAVPPVHPTPAPEAGALWSADPLRTPSPTGRVPYPPPRS